MIIFSHKQAAIDFADEANLEFKVSDHTNMDIKHKIRKLMLKEEIDLVIEEINKIDKKVIFIEKNFC